MKDIRGDFPILDRQVHPGKRLVYLDNAATSQKPRHVINAITQYYEKHNSNIHRGVHKLSEEASELYDTAHEKVARFIGARQEEVIFTRNATESINLVARSLGFRKGDEIVTTVMEHHSNMVPWQMLQSQGVKVRYVDIDGDGMLRLEQFDRLITKRTRLVAVTHVSNVLGTINPVKDIAEMAHAKGSLFLVDGAQAIPHLAVDVQEIGADFYVFSGHKMLGPTGIGVLFGRRDILEKMQPFMFGGDMIKEVTLEGATWNDLPWKFEAGTSNIAGGIGLGAAVDYLERVGMDSIRRHEQELTAYMLDRLKSRPDIRQYGPEDPEQRGGVVSFVMEKVHPHDLASILDTEGVAIRSGHHCAQPLMMRLGLPATNRASFYLYNTKEDVDKFFKALDKAKKVLRI